MDIENNYLNCVKKQIVQYRLLGEKAMSRLEIENLLFYQNDDCNSMAVIVKHLHGNMLSRWTDFLTSDGEKTWRKRAEEFEQPPIKKDEILIMWNEGWNCFFNAIDSLTVEQLSETIYIRGEAHFVVEAINRQIAHYAYHVGQIVFAAKQFKTGAWDSLSIPRSKT